VVLGTSPVLQVGIAAAAAPHESATTTAEVQTGLLELNKETFSDYINAAGDALVVVDFFTDVSLLAAGRHTEHKQRSTEGHECTQLHRRNVCPADLNIQWCGP
jgi:hypothetical protein